VAAKKIYIYIHAEAARIYSFISNPQHAVSNAISIIFVISEARARRFFTRVREGTWLKLLSYVLVFILSTRCRKAGRVRVI
jgi:hypothetical protein